MGEVDPYGKKLQEQADELARLREALSHHDEREHERLLTENVRLRGEVKTWMRAEEKRTQERERLREENTRWQTALENARHRESELTVELARLREELRLLKHNYEALARHVRNGTRYEEEK